MKQSTITLQLVITKHAYQRGKERIGLDVKAFELIVMKAYLTGKRHSEAKGEFKKYINSLYVTYKNANNIRIYGQHIYLFADATLVTVYHIPSELKKYIKL